MTKDTGNSMNEPTQIQAAALRIIQANSSYWGDMSCEQKVDKAINHVVKAIKTNPQYVPRWALEYQDLIDKGAGHMRNDGIWIWK